jgi:hypothetical protein
MPTASKLSFTRQSELFDIALRILNTVRTREKDWWSLGGGTALSYCYYKHRLSFDIDIFIKDHGIHEWLKKNSDITRMVLDNYFYGNAKYKIESSGWTHTILLGNDLKIDFLESSQVTPYLDRRLDVFGFSNISVHSPEEIIARKLKYRLSNLTFRDIVDFYFVQKDNLLISELIRDGHFDENTYEQVFKHIEKYSADDIDAEYNYLMPIYRPSKSELISILENPILLDKSTVDIAIHEGSFFAVGIRVPKLVANEKELELHSISVPADEIKKISQKDRLLTSDIYQLDSGGNDDFKNLIQKYIGTH